MFLTQPRGNRVAFRHTQKLLVSSGAIYFILFFDFYGSRLQGAHVAVTSPVTRWDSSDEVFLRCVRRPRRRIMAGLDRSPGLFHTPGFDGAEFWLFFVGFR